MTNDPTQPVEAGPPGPLPAQPGQAAPPVTTQPLQPQPAWSQEAWQAAAQTSPAGGVPPAARPPEPRGYGLGLVGLIVASVLLSAVLASGGTVLLLSASGHLNTTSTADTRTPAAVASPAAPAGGNQGGTVPQPTAGPDQGGATPGPDGAVPIPDLGDRFGDQLRGRFGDLFGGGPVLDSVAKALGITTHQLVAELQQLGPGDGICTLAARHNVDCATAKSAVRDGVKSLLLDAVTAGDLDLHMADRMVAMVDAWLAAGGNLPSLPRGVGPGSGAGPGSGPGPGDQATNPPWIGVYYVELDPATARDLNTPIDHGALIQEPEGSDQPAVQPGSPGASAGLREGDIVVAMDGQQIDATHSLRDLVLAHKPGDVVKLDIQRGGQTITVSVTLGTRPR